jgi:DNA modification methylase
MNVYEHMFVFKKPGARAIIANNIANKLPKEWKTNIAPFSPVIKINSKGENTLGHTAPFPEDIPNFVAKVFTRSPDDIVLEPFAGSGTSLIACSKCGVKSLGIELCDEYVELILHISKDNNIKITKL